MDHSKLKLVIHRNNKRTSLLAELGFDEEHQTKKVLVDALLSARPMKGNNRSLTNNMLTFRNSGKPSVKKPKLQSTEKTDIFPSSSQVLNNLRDEIPLILRSNDEIRKLAESAEDNCKENYQPATSCEAAKELTKTLVLNFNSMVNSATGFEVGGACVLNTDITQIPYGASTISADQVGTSVDPNNPFAFNAVLFRENIDGCSTKGREIAPNQPKDLFTEMEDTTGSVSPSESLDARQPSPVSVLESPVEPERLRRKRVIADPRELQKQLGLLKSELERVTEPQSKAEPLHLIEDIKLEFTCEEERDFSYLLDILIDSGFHGMVDQRRLLRICYDRHSPVGPMVFSNLEKKYRKIGGWSVSERRLLFDLVNSILAEILAPCMELRPWAKDDRQLGPMWGQEGLVEKLWQIMARKRELLPIGDPVSKAFHRKWIKLGDQIDLIAREVERSIKEELLDELVLEFFLD